MNGQEFLEKHQTEAFKVIARAMGREYQTLLDDGTGCYPEATFFNPLTNGEQWIECLMYARKFRPSTGQYHEIDLNDATASRESLLIALLERIGVLNA